MLGQRVCPALTREQKWEKPGRPALNKGLQSRGGSITNPLGGRSLKIAIV